MPSRSPALRGVGWTSEGLSTQKSEYPYISICLKMPFSSLPIFLACVSRTVSFPSTAFLAGYILSVAAISLTASAELLVYEPFDYQTTTLTGQGGALGTAGIWNSNDSGVSASWALYLEGALSGVVLSDTNVPSAFNGTVVNMPTSGGFVGFNQGGYMLNADIAILPSVTASFQSGSTTWISYVSAWAWNLNAEHANFVLGTIPAPPSFRGDNYGGIGSGGSGFGTGGGPTRNNRTDIYPMFYDAGQYSNVKGAIPDNSYRESAFEVPSADGFNWVRLYPNGDFGAPNIVVMKLEWDADSNGEDIISVGRFLENDTLSEAAFNAMITAQTNLCSLSWSVANKPDLDQSQFDTITFLGVKFFVDEIRIATTFDSVVSSTGGAGTLLIVK